MFLVVRAIIFDQFPPRYAAGPLHRGPDARGILVVHAHTFGLLGDVEPSEHLPEVIHVDAGRCRAYFRHHEDELIAQWHRFGNDPKRAWIVQRCGGAL